MIAKHLILEIVDLKRSLEQESPSLSYVKELIVTPVNELEEIKQELVMEHSPYAYPNFDMLY